MSVIMPTTISKHIVFLLACSLESDGIEVLDKSSSEFFSHTCEQAATLII